MKGDKKILEILNGLLAGELNASDQYFVIYIIFAVDWQMLDVEEQL